MKIKGKSWQTIWLVNDIYKWFGNIKGENIVKAFNKKPSIDLRINPLKIDLDKGLWLLISIPSNSILFLTRKLIPPIGGVDVGPVIWIGFISFLREILVGQQGLIKLALHTHIS